MSDNAWTDLIRAIATLEQRQTGPFPLQCEHDTLYVMSDPGNYDQEVLDKLDEIGFFPGPGGDCFMSYRFGSA